MANINKNKLDLLVAHLTDGGEVSVKAICKAAGLNPRYKSWKGYVTEARKVVPDLIPVDIPEDVQSNDDEDVDALLGADEDEPTCPAGKADEDCCDDPENCKKTPAALGNPVSVEDEKGVFANPAEEAVVPTYAYIDKNNIKTDLEVVKVSKRGVIILRAKEDEIVEVPIQGVIVKVNLTALEGEGKTAEAEFYRSQAK